MSALKYRPEIDGLRAIAVLPVILFHAGFGFFSGGFIGVDVFFVISGYLITSILIKDIEAGQFSLANFYERRARRILPALIVVMALCVPFAWYLMPPTQMEEFSKSLVAVSAFASNILFWREDNYFSHAAELKPLLHTWSLAVEEQYYIAFPLFLFFSFKWGKRPTFWFIVAFTALSLALCHWAAQNLPKANFYLAPFRAWELLAGSLTAFIIQKHGIIKNNTLALLGLIGILIPIFSYSHTTPTPSLYTLLPVLGSAFIILFAAPQTWAAKLLSTRALVGIGLISYSAYLWHQPLLAFARIQHLGAPPPLLLLAALCLLAFLLAFISWKYIEQPFRNKDKVSLKTLAISCASLMILLSLFGLAGRKQGFISQRFESLHIKLFHTATSSPKRKQCHTEGANYTPYDKACEYHKGTLETAIIGDSHAVELAYALANELTPLGKAIKHLSFSGCVPAYGAQLKGKKDCRRWTEDMASHLMQDPRIKTVIVTYRITAPLSGIDTPKDTQGQYQLNPRQKKIWQAYIALLRDLQQSGKHVILTLQAPEIRAPMEEIITQTKDPTAPIIGHSRTWWEQRRAIVKNRLSEIPSGITIIDPTDLFCDDQNCLAAQEGAAYYFDNNHMSVAGAQKVARKIIDEIEKEN